MPRHNPPAFLSYQYLQYENQCLNSKCSELMETVKTLQHDMECLNSFIMAKYDMSGSNVTCVMTDMSGNFIPCLHTDICGNIIPCIMTPTESASHTFPRDFPYYPYYDYPYYDYPNYHCDDDYYRELHSQHSRSIPVPHFPVPPVHPMHPPKHPYPPTPIRGEKPIRGNPPMHKKERCLYPYPYPYPYPYTYY
jgi:hypothetical protein